MEKGCLWKWTALGSRASSSPSPAGRTHRLLGGLVAIVVLTAEKVEPVLQEQHIVIHEVTRTGFKEKDSLLREILSQPAGNNAPCGTSSDNEIVENVSVRSRESVCSHHPREQSRLTVVTGTSDAETDSKERVVNCKPLRWRDDALLSFRTCSMTPLKRKRNTAALGREERPSGDVVPKNCLRGLAWGRRTSRSMLCYSLYPILRQYKRLLYRGSSSLSCNG